MRINLILKRLWSIWAAFWFLLFFLMIIPFQFILIKINTRTSCQSAHYLNTLWAYLTLGLGLVWLKIKQKTRLKKGIYLFVANHNSYLDIPINQIVVFCNYRFMAKAELSKIPLFGWMYKKLHIMVQRDSKIERHKAMENAKDLLNKGISVFIFPEGTIKHPTPLGDFKDGAFQLAIQTKIPVVPITIIDSAKTLSNDGKFYARPSIIKLFVDEPIETQNLTMDDVKMLNEKVKGIMQGHILECS